MNVTLIVQLLQLPGLLKLGSADAIRIDILAVLNPPDWAK